MGEAIVPQLVSEIFSAALHLENIHLSLILAAPMEPIPLVTYCLPMMAIFMDSHQLVDYMEWGFFSDITLLQVYILSESILKVLMVQLLQVRSYRRLMANYMG